MRLVQGDNHQISTREGLAILEVWQRPDLSPEQGADNARQLVEFLLTRVLRDASQYRGLVMDMRRGPPVFGPKTRATLSSLFESAAKSRIAVAVICGGSAIQVLQFRNLCRDGGGRAEVFSSELDAFRFFDGGEAAPSDG